MLNIMLLTACAVAGDPGIQGDQASAATPDTQPGTRRDVTVADLVSEMTAESPVFVLDVRTEREFSAGHVPGAVNIPVGDLAARLTELEPHRAETIWTICAVGRRSAAASDQLAAAGFEAVNVDGGTKGWIDAGHAVEK